MNRVETKRRQFGEFSNILALVTILLLGRWIGDNGVTYVIVAVEAYVFFLNIFCGNVSDTLGRILRSRRNKGQYKGMVQMRRSAMIFHMVVGILGSVLLFLLSDAMAEGIFKVHYSSLIIKVLSPMVFLRSVSAVFLGCFQGEGSEFPTMISEILRRVFILGFGILFSQILGSYGEKVGTLLMQSNYSAMYGGVGFAIGINLTEVLILLFLGLIYRGMCRVDRGSGQEAGYSFRVMFLCIKSLCAGRWSQCATTILGLLPLVLGIYFVDRSSEDESGILEYGIFTGKYLVICCGAVALISLVILPVISKVYAGFRREEQRYVKNVFQSGVHLCLVHGVFAAIFVAVTGKQFGELCCPDNMELVGQMLLGGSSVIGFIALARYFGRILQAGGKKMLVLMSVGVLNVIFLLFCGVLSGVGKAGILSLVYGSVISVFVLCILLGMMAYKQMRMRMDWLNVVIVPLGAGSAAGLLGALLARMISPHVGAFMTLILVYVAASVLYWGLLLFLRNFREQELDVIVGGRLIGRIGQMLHVY